MGRQIISGVLWRPNGSEERDHPPGDFRRHGRAAMLGLAQALEKLGGRRPLEQIAARAGAEGIEDPIIVFVNRQYHQRGFRVSFPQQRQAFQPGHSGQTNIYQNNVRELLPWPRQRVFHRAKRCRAPESLRQVDQGFQAFADAVLVFNNRDFSDWRRQRD